MKVYTAPSVEELTPGSDAFKARVAKVKHQLAESLPPRLVSVPEVVEMIRKGRVGARLFYVGVQQLTALSTAFEKQGGGDGCVGSSSWFLRLQTLTSRWVNCHFSERVPWW